MKCEKFKGIPDPETNDVDLHVEKIQDLKAEHSKSQNCHGLH